MSKEETNININFTDIYACLAQGENHKVTTTEAKGKEAAKQAIEKTINSFSNPTDAKSIVLNFELHPDLMCQPYIILIHKYSKLLFQVVTSFFFQTRQVINFHLQSAFSVYCNKLRYIQI